MYVIGKNKVDKAGRINIRRLFNELPDKIIVTADLKTGKIYFIDARRTDAPHGHIYSVDSKNRVQLPKWIIEDFGQEFYITPESLDDHSLLSKKFC
ncbi:hypothetical protein IJG89_01735 [Candidatus Saccharibacteria bacterium]|nr:hypothetical protein [Candidatus Saccharibacteria bacterium]